LVTRSQLELAISGGPTGIPPDAGPRSLPIAVHPLLSFTPSPEYRAACYLPLLARRFRVAAAAPSCASAPPLGSRSPFAAPAREVPLSGELPFSPGSALGVSHALDGLLLHAPRKLVSSCNHVRDSRFRDFPRCQAAHLLGEPCPHVVAESLLPASCPACSRFPRLAFRALLRAAIRDDQQVG